MRATWSAASAKDAVAKCSKSCWMGNVEISMEVDVSIKLDVVAGVPVATLRTTDEREYCQEAELRTHNLT